MGLNLYLTQKTRPVARIGIQNLLRNFTNVHLLFFILVYLRW